MNIILDVNKYFLLRRVLRETDDCKNKKIKKLLKKIKEVKKQYNDNLCVFPFLEELWQLECALPLIFFTKSKKNTNFLNNINKVYKKIFKLEEFQCIYEETLKFKDKLQLEWDSKFNFIKKYLESILKMKIPVFTANIFLMHPDLNSGRCYAGYKTIVYGHYDDWQNYNMVYIVHEWLHMVFNELGIKGKENSHALIQLIADNELRIRLNKKGKYFKEGKLGVGHQYLRKIEKDILPYWKKYLKNSKEHNKNIITLYRFLDKTLF